MREGPNGSHVLLTEIGLLLSWSARPPRARCCSPRAVPPPKSATLLRLCPHILVKLRYTRRSVVSLSSWGAHCFLLTLWGCCGCAHRDLGAYAPPPSGDCPRHPSECSPGRLRLPFRIQEPGMLFAEAMSPVPLSSDGTWGAVGPDWLLLPSYSGRFQP